MKNREGYFVGLTERECTRCGVIFTKTSRTVTTCNTCNSTRVKGESPETRMFRRSKARAKERGHTFNINKDDVIIPEFCPVLGIKLEVFSGSSGGRDNSPALDRVDNSKGYEKDNVMVISHLANMMKSSATKEQLLSFADWVYRTYEPTSD